MIFIDFDLIDRRIIWKSIVEKNRLIWSFVFLMASYGSEYWTINVACHRRDFLDHVLQKNAKNTMGPIQIMPRINNTTADTKKKKKYKLEITTILIQYLI